MEQNTENQEVTINLADVFRAFLRRWWIILLAAIIGAGALLGYNLVTSEQYYEAEIRIYINSKITDSSSSMSSSELTTNRNLVSTFAVIAKERDVIDMTIDNAFIRVWDDNGVGYHDVTLKDKYEAMGLNVKEVYSLKNVTSHMTVEGVNDTEVLSVCFQTTDPDDSLALANSFYYVFPDVAKEIVLGTEPRSFRLATATTEISKGTTKMTAIGFAAGLVIAAAVVFVMDVLVNDTIENEEWIRERFGEEVPLLTVIPDEDETNGKYGYKYSRYTTYTNEKEAE